MKTKRFQLIVEEDMSGLRLDICLSKLVLQSSRSFLQKLIKSGCVKVDGEVCDNQRLRVKTGMRVEAEFEEANESAPLAEQINLPVLYEDNVMMAIDKPAGMVVHPAAGNWTGTVVNALLGRYPDLADTMSTSSLRPGIVHRLDKDTSGVMLLAKTPEAQFRLSKAFADRKVAKHYLAITLGIPKEPHGEICTLIGRHPVNRMKMAVVASHGKEAVTVYDLLNSGTFDGVPLSLLDVAILTGRTHQIRVHMSTIGHPVLGDRTYGGDRHLHVERQMLHAWRIKLPHPATGELIEFEAPPPEDFQKVIIRLKQQIEQR